MAEDARELNVAALGVQLHVVPAHNRLESAVVDVFAHLFDLPFVLELHPVPHIELAHTLPLLFIKVFEDIRFYLPMHSCLDSLR